MSAPLAGVTILDLSRILAGPYCTMLLGDLGAEVLKVEPPGGDDSRGWGPPFASGESAYFLAVNRNKKSICINLKRPRGGELLRRLANNADVLVENFRPGTLERLGLGYEELKKTHPEIIYCSISGYGHSGPLEEKPGYDAVMQGEGGWMSLTGETDGPPLKVGASLADIFAGVMGAQGILAALYDRARSGKGRHVDVSLFDSVLATLCYQAQGYLLTGEVPARMGNRHPSLAPYEAFQTADGYVILGVGNDALWRSFCQAVGKPDLDQPRFETNALRVENYAELKALLVPLLRGAPTKHWLDALEPAGIPVGRVRSVAEALQNPQVEARNMLIDTEHPVVGPLRMIGNPIKMSGLEENSPPSPPLLGQHTEEVLSEKLNLSREEIEALRREGALGS
jgi:crotonobetainyl-CoA:carnitine CoA-transferase CaiB-like acyl-CoA transferase